MTDSPPFECGPECPAPEHELDAPHGTGCACEMCPDYDGPVKNLAAEELAGAAEIAAYRADTADLWLSMAANEHGVDWDHQAGAEPAQEMEL